MKAASSYFKAVACKRLQKIDLVAKGSHQHELQGINSLKVILGTGKRRPVQSLWRGFDEDGLLTTEPTHQLTWYDARENSPERAAEWRLYYPAGTPLDDADVGDLLVVAQPREDGPLAYLDIVLYVIPWDSDLRNEVVQALGLGEPGSSLQSRSEEVLAKAKLLALHEEILRSLEPAFQAAPEPLGIEEAVRRRFADFLEHPHTNDFPRPAELAAFSRDSIAIDPDGDADKTLVDLLDIETRAFHVLENEQLAATLRSGFATVDQFLRSAQSALQRRKSRRGRSLELHLAHLFRLSKIPFEEQVKADGDTTVDFLFPELQLYKSLAASAPAGCGVISLASKSTIKERWRQVLREARKLSQKHLCTLQPGISPAQIAEMKEAGVVLVIPRAFQGSYKPGTARVLSVSDFIARVRTEVR